MAQVHRRHRYGRRHPLGGRAAQPRAQGTHAQRRTGPEQLLQGRRDPRLPFLGGQVQQLDVIPVGPGGVLGLQLVVGPAEQRARVQVGAEGVAGEGARLAHQPGDDVAVVDQVPVLAPQPGHPLHQRIGIPDFDLLDPQPHLDPLPDQPRRHRVDVPPHLDGTAPPYPHLPALLRLQPPRRQGAQDRHLGRQRRLPPRVPLPHQLAQERLVGPPVGEVAAAPQQQGLRHRVLEPPVALLAVAVLVAARRVGGLRGDPIVGQQRPVGGREPLRLPVGVHRQRHAVGAVPGRHPAQGPEGVLQPRAQAGEALREADGHVLPVRVSQHEVVDQVRERLPGDGHAHVAHVGEVRGAQPARLMDLGEVDLLVRAVLRLPGPYPSLQRPPHPVRVFPRVGALQPVEQGHRLQGGLLLEQRLQLRPHRGQRVPPRPPGAGPAALAGQALAVAVLACALAVHVGLHRRLAQRCPSMQPIPQFLDLGVGHATDSPHRQLLSPEVAVVLLPSSCACPPAQWGRIIVGRGDK